MEIVRLVLIACLTMCFGIRLSRSQSEDTAASIHQQRAQQSNLSADITEDEPDSSTESDDTKETQSVHQPPEEIQSGNSDTVQKTSINSQETSDIVPNQENNPHFTQTTTRHSIETNETETGNDDKRGQTGNSEGDRGTTEARDQHNSATDVDTSVPIQNPVQDDIHSIVRNLQSELQETRRDDTRTRSVMMVIQEKQEEQDRNLSFLKDEIDQIKRQQLEDKQIITALQGLVADNVWALNNVKVEQDHIKRDFQAMKGVQEQINLTHSFMQETLTGAAEDRQMIDSMYRQLQGEVVNIRAGMTQDRNNIKTIVEAVNLKLNKNKLSGAKGDVSPNEAVENSDEFSADNQDGDTMRLPEGSADQSERIDQMENRFEEQREIMEGNMITLNENTQKVRQEVDDLTRRVHEADTVFARFHTMFFNLSFQQASLENQFLRYQQNRHEKQMELLQRSLVNFTQHVLEMERLQSVVSSQLNTTSQNQHEISRMSLLVETMASRVRTLEELVLEYRSSTHSSYNQLLDTVSKVNDSVLEFHNVFTNHDYHASNVFEEADARFARLSRELREHDNRLAHVEVHMLNTSLQECQKTNSDVMQDMQLNNFTNGVSKLDNEMNQQSSRIQRIDRSLSRLYQNVDEQTTIIHNVVGQVESVVTVIPEVVQLRSQVKSLVEVLPKDCRQLRNSMNVPQEGSYLIKPDGSPHTAHVYCQFTQDNGTEDSWTVIQTRVDGRISFARGWDEYKAGFGDATEEFWVGNDNLHYLTTQGDYELRIEMWDTSGLYYYAHYDIFYIDNEDSNYRLHINNYHGNATDSMRYSNYMDFSTLDRDNDVSSTHCAKFYTSGWWYKHCHYSNLNGRYSVGIVWFNQNYDQWIQLTKTVMKIRRRLRYTASELQNRV